MFHRSLAVRDGDLIIVITWANERGRALPSGTSGSATRQDVPQPLSLSLFLSFFPRNLEQKEKV